MTKKIVIANAENMKSKDANGLLFASGDMNRASFPNSKNMPPAKTLITNMTKRISRN